MSSARSRRPRVLRTGQKPRALRTLKRALGGSYVAPWVIDSGARSNPRAEVELSRLGVLHGELLRRASVNPREPRPIPTKVSPVLETVTMVLELAGKPMRVRDVHAGSSKAQRLVDQDDGNSARKAAVDDEKLIERAVHAVRTLRPLVLERKRVLVNPA